MALESFDFEGMAARLGPEGGALDDAAAALIEVPLADGRTVWYLGPRWFVSIPC